MLKIRTNNVPRLIIDSYQLTPKERVKFDYINWDSDEGACASFFRFKGHLYDISEFMRCPDEMKPWDGYSSDSYFSGVVFRYVRDDMDRVIVGQYFS